VPRYFDKRLISASLQLRSQSRGGTPAAMPLPILLHWVGYTLGSLGVVLLIWSMLKQGVSLLGLVSLIIGFLSLVIADLIVYSIAVTR
jgi:hypothetical protein